MSGERRAQWWTTPIAQQPRWIAKTLRALVTYTPLRSPRVRRAVIDVVRARSRWQRHRLEARGDASLSKPAMYEIDTRLADLLGRNGYFVESGANDGYLQSNTYYLERMMGWRGLLVEPLPYLAAQARRNRPKSRVIAAALSAPEDSGSSLRMKEAGLMSVVAGAQGSEQADREYVSHAFARGDADVREIDVPARTLSELLDEVEAPEIDLLSLDVEGYEPQALKGLDLSRHAPRWILVEAISDERRRVVGEVLGDRYILVERFSELDDLYRRADVKDPRAA